MPALSDPPHVSHRTREEQGYSMAFKGMDPEQGRDVAQAIKQAGEKIKGTFADLNTVVSGVEWEGPDADAYKEDWTSFFTQRVDGVVEQFATRSKDLDEQAEEQDTTSNSNA
jgi:uncharacterized protein YukE